MNLVADYHNYQAECPECGYGDRVAPDGINSTSCQVEWRRVEEAVWAVEAEHEGIEWLVPPLRKVSARSN